MLDAIDDERLGQCDRYVQTSGDFAKLQALDLVENNGAPRPLGQFVKAGQQALQIGTRRRRGFRGGSFVSRFAAFIDQGFDGPSSRSFAGAVDV